jgi:hypothetical protein
MRRRHLAWCLLIVLFLAGSTACTSTAPPPPPPPEPLAPFTEVVLQAVGGEQCVAVEPDPAVIWRQEEPGKPHQVRWSVRRGDTAYRWVFEHQADKGGDDFFGGRVIPCRASVQAVTSGLPQRLPPGGVGGEEVTWGYQVTLYGCEPGRLEKICTLDPAIIIRDLSGP